MYRPSSTSISVQQQPALNLLDFMTGNYVNSAFVAAQTALYQQGIRGLYVPGNRTYYLDPDLPEIQLVLDDLHVFGENSPVFYSTAALQGCFQVVYADRVRVEGISIILDPSITRTDPEGTYAGSKYNGRRSGIGTYDSDDFSLNNIFVRNLCGAWIGKGYHTHADYTTWKALSQAARITTPFDLTNVNNLERSPELARSLVRAGGFTKIERLSAEHCDFAVLYNNHENITLYDIDCRDTTITQAHPHAVYAAGNLVYNVYKNGTLSNPLLPEHTLLKDGTNGVCKATKLRSYGNIYANAFKFRIHDQVTVSDIYAEATGGGISFINCDGAVLDGGTVKDMQGGLGGDGDDDDDDPDEVFGYGLRVNGCRGGTYKNLSIYMAAGVPAGSAVYILDVAGGNQRRNTTTGELFYSDDNIIENIFVKTNYADEDENRDFDPDTFDPESIEPPPIFRLGNNQGLMTNAEFRNIRHLDAWGHYPSAAEMFYFDSGTNHKIINPVRKGTAPLLRARPQSGGHTVIVDPTLIEHYDIIDQGSPLTRVFTTSPINGDNTHKLADFGRLSTPEEVAQTFTTAAEVVGSLGSSVIDLPAMTLTIGALAATDVSAGEGDGVRLTRAMSNIIFRGNGTTLKPDTNKIVMFSIVGAENITFEGIHFDNSDNGLLQDQFKPTTQSAGGGIAGLGNAANSAIKQFYGGANATITSGTYDDGTGVIVLTMSAAGTFTVGDRANLYSLTGTGAYASLNDTPWLITAATTTVVTIAGTAGLGASTITGGSLHTYKAKSHVKVRDCEFTEFHTSIGYFGNQSNTAELVGDLLVDKVKFTGCVFGVLCQQPRTLSFTNFDFNDGQNSLNDSGVPQTNDPGHALYFANRNGAYPESIIATDGRGTNNRSSLIKIRKGNSVVLSDIAIYASHRGVEVWNVKALTASNISVILADVDGAIDDDGLVDTNASGFELTDCGNYEVDNLFVNRSGCNAWGVRVRESSGGESWQNLDGRIKGVTVKDDSSASTGKAFVVIGGQTDLDIVAPIARLTANTAHAKEVVDLNDCTRVHVHRPKRRSAAASNPTGSDRLVNLDADCSACVVEYTREDMDVAPTSNTVIDAGTGTKIIRVDGEQSGTWTPTLAFATAGDGVVTVNSSDCLWFKCGPRWRLVYNIDFTTNAYTTASGNLRLTGTLDVTGTPALPAAVTANVRAAVGIHQKIVGTANDIGIGIDTGNNYMTLRRSVMAGAGAALDTANFPASTANYILGGEISFLAAET